MARQMKDSGVEWIGEIPEDTKLIQLRFIADITTGNMDTQNRENDGEYPFYVRSPKVERSNQYSFDDVEAILMAGDGVGAGRVFHYVQGKYACHQRVYRMNNFRYVQSSFLKYYLEGLFPMIMDQGSAKSTVDSVRLPMLQGFKVVVFNEAEQQKIIDFLDEKVGEIDSVIAKTKETIEDYKKYKQAIITNAVTKGLNPDVEMKDSEIEWIDKIPSYWEEKKIKQCVYIRARLGWKGLKADEYVESGYPFLSAFNIINSKLDFSEINYINQFRYEESPEIKLNIGDVLLVKDGAGIGKCAYVDYLPQESTVNGSIALLTVDKSLSGKYLYYFLLSKLMQKYVDRIKGGMGVPHLFQRDIKEIRISMPPLEEQKEIVEYLDEKCSEINKLIAKKEELLADLEDYKKSLIYEYVTGKKEVE